MNPDYSKRDYLLQTGCKDLIDVINLQAQRQTQTLWLANPSKEPPPIKNPSKELSPITKEVLVSEKTTVGELAALLGQKPFTIIADLLELGVFASISQSV